MTRLESQESHSWRGSLPYLAFPDHDKTGAGRKLTGLHELVFCLPFLTSFTKGWRNPLTLRILETLDFSFNTCKSYYRINWNKGSMLGSIRQLSPTF